MEKLLLQQLTEETMQALINANASEHYKRVFKCVSHKLLIYAEEHNIDTFSMDSGIQFLEDCYSMSQKISEKKWHGTYLRCINAMSEYQLTGTVDMYLVTSKKTVFSVNFAIGLARQKKKVLLLDMDPQGSATISLGYQQPDIMDITLATILGKIINDEEFDPMEGILHHEEGIYLMPGNIELAGLEVTMVNVMSRELLLRRYISMVRDQFDVIVIDNTPSLGMLSINSLACADQVIIPCSAGYLPARGLEELIKTIGKVKRQINPNLMISGIVITMLDSRTNYAKEIVELIEETYGNHIKVFQHRIPMSVRVAECSALGCSIYKHDSKGKAAQSFEGIVDEVLAYDCA